MIMVTFQAARFQRRVEVGLGVDGKPLTTVRLYAEGYYGVVDFEKERFDDEVDTLSPVSGEASLDVFFRDWDRVHFKQSVAGKMAIMLPKDDQRDLVYMEIDGYLPLDAAHWVFADLEVVDGDQKFLTMTAVSRAPSVSGPPQWEYFYGESSFAEKEGEVTRASFYEVSLFPSVQRLERVHRDEAA
ncbi:hypothetical protein [Cognatiyoonia sp. IB215182]|uniref:hypothetical protein n=1 Tax=Cognatiyoonia sp. IB215182 TaxID=3097353 RepID=UPI002A0CDB25|nr:hypothetical protein [Cognatiyoonia sp. IB215182]MDX8351353.1 hypothetical protein [Cognatiyoonia sp. IB215182]